MVDCPFRTEQGSCKIVDNGVGAVVPLGEDVCNYCIKTHPDLEIRHLSDPVRDWTFHGRRRLGKTAPIPTKPRGTVFTNTEKTIRPNRCEDLGSVVKRNTGCNCPRKSVYNCDRFKDENNNPLQVIPNGQCSTCPNYVDSQETF